jgi:hypothetical protein
MDSNPVYPGVLRIRARAAQRAFGRAAPPKSKMTPAKKDFPRFQLAVQVSPKDVALLVNLARSAPGTYRETSFSRGAMRAVAL